jgi:ADP-ribose pyrophosphatase YjhB (NUDIX family)
MNLSNAIIEVDDCRLALTNDPWKFATAGRKAIDDHWAALVQNNPHAWNGRTLLTVSPSIGDGRFSANCIETDYASFIAWRDWGFPDRSVYNCFGSAVIRSSDNALIYGQMAAHTLNAGMCYPPGGSLEPADVQPDGSIDIISSIGRELAEETGLSTRDARHGETLIAFDQQRISVARVLDFAATADELASRIRTSLKQQHEPELDGIVILRDTRHLPAAMPGYARQLATRLLPH